MTPLRIVLSILAIASGAVVTFALLLDSSPTKLPLLVASLSVFGIVIGILGLGLAGTAARTGEEGRLGRALLIAFIGGLFVLAAAGSLGFAIVLGILAGGVA